jgi:hypothetical protein
MHFAQFPVKKGTPAIESCACRQLSQVCLSNSMLNGMSNGNSGIPVPAEKWVLVLRKGVNSRDAKTTGASEGWHRSLKQLLLFYCPQMHMRRLDHLLDLLFTHVRCQLPHQQLARDTGAMFSLCSGFRVLVHVWHGHSS